MTVYTTIGLEEINEINRLSGLKLHLDSLAPIYSGATDSCYKVSDDKNQFFLKIHENEESSPHGLNLHYGYMIDFSDYLAKFNGTYKHLKMLKPQPWLDKMVYGEVKFGNLKQQKVVSIWPYITPRHPIQIDGKFQTNLIRKFGSALAELHIASLSYKPRKINNFPKDIHDTVRVMKKLTAISSDIKEKNIDKYLKAKNIDFRGSAYDFISLLGRMVDRGAKEYELINLELEKGYIHGEIKPSNCLIGSNEEIIFIDLCKSGYAPYILELGMAAQNFTNADRIDYGGISSFVKAYLSKRKCFNEKELEFLPLMIKVSALRLAVYRTYAVAVGYLNQKSIFSPIKICHEIESSNFHL